MDASSAAAPVADAPRNHATDQAAAMDVCPASPTNAHAVVLRKPDSQPHPTPTPPSTAGQDPPRLELAPSSGPSSPAVTRRLSFRDAVSGQQEPSLSPSDRPRSLLPTADALAAVRKLYADKNSNPAAILAAAKQAQPEAIPDALFSLTAQVSSSLVGVSRPALIMALSAVGDNAVVRAVLDAGEIVHIHRQPQNKLLFYLRSEEAKMKLASQRCQFMGRKLVFDSLNPLSDAFYVDILGVRSDDVASGLFSGFLGLGCQPLYYNFTYRSPVGAITSGIVRYYFNSSRCPPALVIQGQICDQVLLGGVVYSARARGAQALHYHLRPNKLSQHALRFEITK
ncbi:hypothetical protein PF005_g21433 [Phytophthora fragariae]|uniref:Uncharacterized protein n=1 Tax=Phytophthora fragariae TaxID=53985 RepID=A0A6A3XF20_9STRA|nr:hypothetical protein PF003_g17430 [Phytophthora fragariae]KAE8927375.1 hypothetical protein PF009_g22456 [Phytophthora fragariae]KAE8986387.1 hypothetical protein PF011_g20008 [Phytophthora fragariae]KAE9084436.1 hypothetical protein PF007_g21521 [Phytophthora fragariae]KAE9086463.1 hypothetical protein PF010_g20072 [Phytophthora fragariae]